MGQVTGRLVAYGAVARGTSPMIAWAAFTILLCASVGWSCGALAACSNETAHAKAQEFAAIAKRKMQTSPDEMGDLAGEFGDTMAGTAGKVTEQTCTKLDELIQKASRL